jgi:pyranose oxidase
LSIRCDTADVLIVGSGPVGATFARILTEQLPGRRVLMLDVGPQLTKRAGMHVMNISSIQERLRVQAMSEGPLASGSYSDLASERAALNPVRRDLRTHPGTFLLDPKSRLSADGMPAAAMSSNVGGMGSHWTCACPRPADVEMVPFINGSDMNQLFADAEKLLQVTHTAFPKTSKTNLILTELKSIFGDRMSADRPVKEMPMASARTETGERLWSGTDTVLGSLADPISTPENFNIYPETLCLELFTDGRGVKYATVQDLRSKKITRIEAQIVVVAGDAFRTPQLLWKSGFRMTSLGHYLNDHPQSVCTVKLRSDLAIESSRSCESLRDNSAAAGVDPMLGMYWIPFTLPEHPFQGQIAHWTSSPLRQANVAAENAEHLSLVWFCRKTIQFEDRLEFNDNHSDVYGMPQARIHYRMTEKDKSEIAESRNIIKQAASRLGSIIDGGDTVTMPFGSSLHYQGTTRMGASDDGMSVCDAYSQVWGTTNLFVGGNGVIPTATACNPTLTSVALAIRACKRIKDILT